MAAVMALMDFWMVFEAAFFSAGVEVGVRVATVVSCGRIVSGDVRDEGEISGKTD